MASSEGKSYKSDYIEPFNGTREGYRDFIGRFETLQTDFAMVLDKLDMFKGADAALEVVNPKRRASGFNVRPFVCVRPELGSMLGYARTLRIRAAHPPAPTL